MPAPAADPEWTDVMTGLTGLRLAIFDELLRHGAMDASTIEAIKGPTDTTATAKAKLEEAVAWLESHRLLVAHEGRWRAIQIPLARMTYEQNGPIRASDRVQVQPKKTAERGATAAVHRHQREFFCNDGYRESLGTVN